MSDFFWKQLNHISGIFAIGVFFCLAAFAANIEVKDLDLWLHLKTGKYIVENGAVPAHDILSCTIAGRPWNNHEWLFQVIVYGVKSLWDFDGLITMQSAVVCITFLILLYIGYRRDRQWLAVFTLLLVLLVYQSRFTIRPDIFSLLFFSLQMYLLALHLDKRICLPVMAVIQVLWVNMHGFFFFGPLLVLIGLVAEWIKRKVPLPYEWNAVGRLTDAEFRRLLLIFGVLLLMCMVNPLGIEGALYPLKVLFHTANDAQIFFKHILELQRPFGPGHAMDYLPYKALILVSFVTFIFNRRQLDIGVFLVWLAFLVFSLIAIRNMIFFAVAAYLVIMINSMTIVLDDILPLRFTAPKFKELTAVLGKIALIMWMYSHGLGMIDRGYFDIDTYERKSEFSGVSKRSFPYKAVDFLVANEVQGNFFNDFNSGAYLVGRTFPKIKVFIDGRTEVYGAEYFRNYQKVWNEGNKKYFRAAEKKYTLTGAFLNGANQQVPPAAVRLFYGLKDWKLVYFDYDGMIFLKDVPQNRALINRYAIDLKKWQPPKVDLQRLGAKRIWPFYHIQRAKMLMALKIEGPAWKELQHAVKIAPEDAEIHRLIADIYGHRKEYQKAFEHFRIAAMFAPNAYNRKGLAWSYEKLGNYPQALKHYERLFAQDPGNAKIKVKVEKLRKMIQSQKPKTNA